MIDRMDREWLNRFEWTRDVGAIESAQIDLSGSRKTPSRVRPRRKNRMDWEDGLITIEQDTVLDIIIIIQSRINVDSAEQPLTCGQAL